MTPYYSDTHPNMESLQVMLLRETPPWRKMEMMAELNIGARELAIAGLRQRFPETDETTLIHHLADTLIGPDKARKVHAEMASPHGDELRS
jgi:hypothetical protein